MKRERKEKHRNCELRIEQRKGSWKTKERKMGMRDVLTLANYSFPLSLQVQRPASIQIKGTTTFQNSRDFFLLPSERQAKKSKTQFALRPKRKQPLFAGFFQNGAGNCRRDYNYRKCMS